MCVCVHVLVSLLALADFAAIEFKLIGRWQCERQLTGGGRSGGRGGRSLDGLF